MPGELIFQKAAYVCPSVRPRSLLHKDYNQFSETQYEHHAIGVDSTLVFSSFLLYKHQHGDNASL